jgi:uncharacterized membrane protein YgdD (TMEM256/DUF423 family)
VKPNWIFVGALLAALAVVSGAFGAHALKDRLTPAELELWKTAVLYHALHAIATMLCGIVDRESRLAGGCFVAGVALFSGSLYALALGAPHAVGAITPVGGLLLIAGWIVLALRARRR